MAGTSYLPLVVEVAFGADPLDTGTLTWTDISAHVKRGTGLDFSRGWDTESGEPMSGRLTFTLNNDGGDFTPGATGTYGLVRNRLPVRVSAVVGTATGNPLTYDDAVGWYDMDGATYDDAEIGTIVLWTGLVESWRITWENGVRSQVAVTCVDRWAAIRRLKLDGKFIERVVTSQTPTNFWTFTSPTSTAGRCEPTVGSVTLIPEAVISSNPAGTLDAPSAANPQSWLDLPTATATPYIFSGAPACFYQPSSYTANGATSIAFTVSAWMKDAGQIIIQPRGAAFAGIEMSSAAGTDYYLRATRTTGPDRTDYTAAQVAGWSHYALSLSVDGAGAVTVKMHYNGALVKTDTTKWTSGGWTLVSDLLTIEAPTGVAYLAVWSSALTDAEILEQYRAGTTMGVAGETADVRAQRLLTMVSPAPSLSDTGTFTSTMSKQSLVDKSLGEGLMECAAAEAGALYIDTAGWPVLTARSWRVGSAVAFTVPATALSADVSWTLDDQQLCNSATVDRMVGDESAGQVKSRNDTSIADYGEQNRSLSLWLHTDAQALDRANAEANMFSIAMPRSADLSVDLLSKAATIPAATLLGADIGDRIAVSGMPSEAPGETEFYVESIADRVSASEWQRTFTVSPRLDFWTLQDATYGVIDSVFVLAY